MTDKDLKDDIARLNETLEALLIVNMRLYDLLTLVATDYFDNEDEGEVPNPVDVMLAAHARGKVLGPLPSYELPEEAGTDDDS